MKFNAASQKSSRRSSRKVQAAHGDGFIGDFVSSLQSTLGGMIHGAAPEFGAAVRPAGVLVPLFESQGSWHVILNVRSEHVGQHKGEVAFPGGALEPDDVDLAACALREAWEEMGIRPDEVTVLGKLDPVVTRTDYVVQPVVGVIPYPYDFVVSDREVAGVLEVPLHWLLDGSAHRPEARVEPDGMLARRLSYAFEDYLIFGATAQILTQLLSLVQISQDRQAPTEVPA